MSTRFCTMLLMLGLAVPAEAQLFSPLPDWPQLENEFAQDGNLSSVETQMSEAIRMGTPVEQAVAGLSKAGWACKISRDHAGIEHCLLDRYSLADGAADDIRWTLRLDTDSGRVRSIALNRSVDRHGGN